MTKSVRKSKLKYLPGIFLAGLSTACSLSGEIDKETQRILEQPIEMTGRDYLTTSEELDVYKRGKSYLDAPDSLIVFYPIGKRNASHLLETIKGFYSAYNFAIDSKTNQLITKIPKEKNNSSEEAYKNKAKEIEDFINLLDIEPAQYRILTYSMRVSATNIDLFRSSLELLIEKGDLGFSLDSQFLNERADKGIKHALTGILDPVIPEVKLDLFLTGLQRRGYVNDLSLTTMILENGEEAEISGTQKIEIKKIIPFPQAAVIVPEFTDVKREIKVIPRSLAKNQVYLQIKALESEVTPSGKDLPNINTRNISLGARLRLGQTWVIGSTLDRRRQGNVEESPVFGSLVSGKEEEHSKSYVFYFVRPTRIDINQDSKSSSIDTLEKEIEKK